MIKEHIEGNKYYYLKLLIGNNGESTVQGTYSHAFYRYDNYDTYIDPRYDLPPDDPNYLPWPEYINKEGNSVPVPDLYIEDGLIDIKIEHNYIPTADYTFGNIGETTMTVTSAAPLAPGYAPVDDITRPWYWYCLVGVFVTEAESGFYEDYIAEEDPNIERYMITNNLRVLDNQTWRVTSQEYSDGIYTTVLKPIANVALDKEVYTELNSASFSTLYELLCLVFELIVDKCDYGNVEKNPYQWDYRNLEQFIPSIDSTPVSKSFLHPGITLREVLKMICEIYSVNIYQLKIRGQLDDYYEHLENYGKTRLTVIWSYITRAISPWRSWKDSECLYSIIADYNVPPIGKVMIGDYVSGNLINYGLFPKYIMELNNNALLDADNQSQQTMNAIIQNAALAGAYKTATWSQGTEDNHAPNTSMTLGYPCTPMKIMVAPPYYAVTGCLINANGMYDIERYTNNTAYKCYVSRIEYTSNSGTLFECNSTQYRTGDNDWEGRPFINGITTIIDGEEVNLYPDHVYGWKIRGVNCPTDDYSIGNISSYYEMTFDSDIRLPVGQQGKVIGDDSFIFEVVGVERKIRTKNIYTETCIITVNEVDEVIPDSSLTPVTNETLDALAYRLLGAHLPSIAINKNYVVNKDWAYSGITKRQLAQWIYQLAGISYCGYGQDSEIVGNERSYFAPAVCPTYVRHAFHFSENDTKSIDKADYQTQVIDKIWFTNDNTNSGFSYGTGTQQLTVPYNPLIDTSNTSFIQSLFNKVNSLVQYTPMKIETFLGKITLSELIRIYAGNDAGTEGREFITWMMYYDPEEEEAYYCPIFNWEASDSGIILQGTGSKDRRVSNSYLDYDTQQTGRYAKISSAASSAASEAGQVSGDVTALSNRVSNCEDDIAQNALDIQSKVSNTDYNGNTIINKINANGVTQTISSSRVDLSSCVPSSSYNGDTIIDKINTFGVTGVIDASRVDLSGLTTTYDGTSIITAINDSTTVGLIDANKVDLSGYTPPSYTGDSLINSINAVGVTSVIDADRVDLSGYVQDSELSNYVPNTAYTGDEIISRINSTGVTSTIDGSRISGDLSTEDYSLDNTGLTFFDGNGVTTTIYPSGGLLTDFSGTSNFRYVTDYTNTQNFTIPAGKHFCVEVQVFPTNSGSGLPTGLLIAGAPDENQELVTSSIIKEVINTSMPTSQKLSLTLVGKADTTTTYYIWIKTDSPYASMTTSYIGWYM